MSVIQDYMTHIFFFWSKIVREMDLLAQLTQINKPVKVVEFRPKKLSRDRIY